MKTNTFKTAKHPDTVGDVTRPYVVETSEQHYQGAEATIEDTPSILALQPPLLQE